VLEIGPGLRPTAPATTAFFVESSPRAATALGAAGGRSVRVAEGPLPFRDGSFGGVFALEVLEHVEEDVELLREIRRVLRPGGVLVVSVPVHMSRWSAIDEACGHVRRYEDGELIEKLTVAGFVPERFHERPARGGSGRLAKVGTAIQASTPRLANWWLQSVAFPIHAKWQGLAGRVQWTDPAVPVSARAAGITVLARSAPDASPGEVAPAAADVGRG